jgi:hypothetical protein
MGFFAPHSAGSKNGAWMRAGREFQATGIARDVLPAVVLPAFHYATQFPPIISVTLRYREFQPYSDEWYIFLPREQKERKRISNVEYR